MEAKNLAEVQSRTKKRAAGATTDVKSLLFQFAWWMKKEGYAESTITTRVKLLKILAKRGADLYDSESVKETIARQKWCNKRKVNAADAYTAFLRMTGEEWDPPKYKVVQKLPFIPTEAELNALIAGCGPKTSTFLELLKETGARAGEAHSLKWLDIDFETGTVRITPEKGSKPRIFKLSNTLLNMLGVLKAKNNSKCVFSKSLRTMRRLFQKQRENIARKLQNPRLLQIHFHSFRHWKATMLYHQTKDILYVMQFLGHRNIKNTLLYVQLEEALFKEENEEFTCKVAKTIGEAKTLVELGFDYVCEFNGAKLFRKRK
jgi:integrase